MARIKQTRIEHRLNDYILATASEDCYIKIWSIPEGGLTENLTDTTVPVARRRTLVLTLVAAARRQICVPE